MEERVVVREKGGKGWWCREEEGWWGDMGKGGGGIGRKAGVGERKRTREKRSRVGEEGKHFMKLFRETQL